MRTPKINESFTCLHCNKKVDLHKGGSCRNHCRFCLYSLHVDKDIPGDRMSDCAGLMQPISVEQHSKKGYMLTHKCQKCGYQSRNKLAPDDDMEMVFKLSKELGIY